LKKVIISANTVWYLANFRLNLSRVLLKLGYEIVAVAPDGKDAERLSAFDGIRFVPLPMDSKGINPFLDLRLCLKLYQLLRREKPLVYLGYTIKPNIYGGVVCRLLKIPSIHNVSGLGTAFVHDTWLTTVVKLLYRIAFAKSPTVFFQNPDDMSLFLEHHLVGAPQAVRLPGSGVDVNWFAPDRSKSSHNSSFCFLLSARLLWDKGIGEFVEAARTLLNDGRDVEFQLLGFLGVENSSAIPEKTIQQWEQAGIIRYLGSTDDVRHRLAQADCVVLPSYYREGVPRSLLEAASMAIPVITTDAVGCREVVDDGVTGYLCKPRDANDLSDKMRLIMDMPSGERVAMGQKGREKMLREFNEKLVIDRYLVAIRHLE